MKRAQLGALWIATIVVTWFVVRGRADDHVRAADVEEPVVASVRTGYVSAGTRPALARHGREKIEDPAFETALATLEHDMADGRWSLEDRDRLNNASRRIDGRQVKELYKVLFPRLNDGTVKSNIAGPPI